MFGTDLEEEGPTVTAVLLVSFRSKNPGDPDPLRYGSKTVRLSYQLPGVDLLNDGTLINIRVMRIL